MPFLMGVVHKKAEKRDFCHDIALIVKRHRDSPLSVTSSPSASLHYQWIFIKENPLSRHGKSFPEIALAVLCNPAKSITYLDQIQRVSEASDLSSSISRVIDEKTTSAISICSLTK
uniref:Uncharacterized protein n=1 Tax=Caenorhabditis japonica TaxID=281687 RepID=A0A8R1E9N8_CAEJA